MVSPKYLLAATAYFSLASSTALSKLTSEQKANPLGLKLGSKSGSVTPPLPDTYHNSVVNYTTPLTSRSLNSRAEKYVGTKDQNCDEYQCYTWWDVYYVQSRFYNDPWHKASGNFYCTGTSECQISQMNGWETCRAWSVGLSGAIQGAIGSASASLGYSYTTCKSGQNTHSCTWSDKQCHCIWTQQQMVETGSVAKEVHYLNGYTGNYYWIWGWAPTEHVNYGCGSKCSDT